MGRVDDHGRGLTADLHSAADAARMVIADTASGRSQNRSGRSELLSLSPSGVLSLGADGNRRAGRNAERSRKNISRPGVLLVHMRLREPLPSRLTAID